MANYPYDEVGAKLDRTFAATLNKNFDEIEDDIRQLVETVGPILDDSFDSAALAAEFEERLNNEIQKLQPDWVEFKQNTTAQLAHTSGFTNSAIRTSPAKVSGKIVQKISDNEYHVISKKQTTKGHVVLQFEKGRGGSGANDSGLNWDLLRLVGVYEIISGTVYKQPNIIDSAGSNFYTNVFENSFSGSPKPKRIRYITNSGQNVHGDSFKTIVETDEKGKVLLTFYGTNGSADKINIFVNDDPKGSFNVRNNGLLKDIELDTGIVNRDIEVRIEVASESNQSVVHFLGYGKKELSENVDLSKYNVIIYQTEGGSHYIHQSIGANDYAFQTIDDGKWKGSYHGGEKSLHLEVYFDEKRIDDMPSETVYGGSVFEIVQKTRIGDRLDSHVHTLVEADGNYQIEVFFDVDNPIKVNNLYIAMTCSSTNFKKTVSPIQIETASGDTPLPLTGKVTQVNPETNQRITTFYSASDKYDGGINAYVRYTSGNYAKFYHGKTVDTTVDLNSIAFSSTKVFD